MLISRAMVSDLFSLSLSLFAFAAWGCSRGTVSQPRLGDVFSDPKVVALCDAVGRGDLTEIDRLVSAGADVNATGKDEVTPLTWALTVKYKPGFRRLLERGADLNKHRKDYPSVTHLGGGIHGDSYWLEEVLSHGGDPNVEIHSSHPDFRDPNDKTRPINWAILGHNTHNVELLIQAGADLNHKAGLFGSTPAMAAATARMYDAAYLLLQAVADYRLKNESGIDLACCAVIDQPPLEGAARGWQDKVLAYLANKGTDLGAVRKIKKGNKTRGLVPRPSSDYSALSVSVPQVAPIACLSHVAKPQEVLAETSCR